MSNAPTVGMVRSFTPSAREVQGILSGRMTQVWRPIRLPEGYDLAQNAAMSPRQGIWWEVRCEPWATVVVRCPFGQPGDRLLVKETTRWSAELDGDDDCEVEYRADGAKLRRTQTDGSGYNVFRDWKCWTPSVHMPRWASRISLEVTEVRVQRIQDISDEDIRRQGLVEGPFTDQHPGAYRGQFQVAWGQAYGAESWGSNPWVWAVTFKRLTGEESK